MPKKKNKFASKMDPIYSLEEQDIDLISDDEIDSFYDEFLKNPNQVERFAKTFSLDARNNFNKDYNCSNISLIHKAIKKGHITLKGLYDLCCEGHLGKFDKKSERLDFILETVSSLIPKTKDLTVIDPAQKITKMNSYSLSS